MSGIFLGFGSNLGDRLGHLWNAVDRLRERGVELTALSSVYETAYVGPASNPQPAFLNCAARVTTALHPLELLVAVQATEILGGRTATAGRLPRTIDIDLLLYDDLTLNTPRLILPHPRMWSRAFVIAPLAEIAPDLQTPERGALRALADDLIARGQAIRCVAGPAAIWSGSGGGPSTV
jgi:2-amino-4-hydroxy-6-hydroxymethyldihydropteridine diphosphokinase